MGEIKCKVENCVYNDKKICTAEKIEVDNNVKTAGGYEMEAATESAVFYNRIQSNNSDETKCNTFKPKK